MRADRLLLIVDLLRRHGRMSAAELARRLEVTPRTVMRDIESLSLLGVPVYAERGRRGGFALLPGYRPDAEDLTPEEARALLLAGGADVAGALGLGEAFARAARRLATGLPDTHAQEVGRLAERVVVDPGGWGGAVSPPASLAPVFEAVQRDRRLRVDYRALSSGHGGRRTLDPWGLVLAGSAWYLIAAHRGVAHTYRLSRFSSVRLLEEPSRRPERLDLAATWRELRTAWNQRPSQPIALRVDRAQLTMVERVLQMVQIGGLTHTDEGEEHVVVRTRVSSLRGTTALLLGFGTWVRALEPPELIAEMVRVGAEAVGQYD